MVRIFKFIYISMTCQRKTFCHTASQTVIRVFPHILAKQESARITSDKKMQTEISIKPEQRDELFYSLLKFTPYQDIQEKSVRIIDLPRQVRLQFNPGVESNKMAQVARQFSLADDDGVGYICSEIIHRLAKKCKVSYTETAAQTDLNVFPHLLQDEHVATVKRETELQTTQ